MSSWLQFMLQDSASPTMNMLMSFHDLILMIMVMLLSIISYMMIFVMKNNFYNRTMKEAHKTELIWTIIPSMILMSLVFPSLRLLYLMDELNQPVMTIKIIGHQWYWSYKYSDFPHIMFDSFMTHDLHLNKSEFRLLEVDNRMVILMLTEIRLLVTASDVIHAWTIPSIGLKADAIPGRLNQLSLMINRAGIFYGQCSESCGANHSFMPIAMEFINMDSFIKWSKIYSSN